MESVAHPDLDRLLSATEGEPGALRDVLAHLDGCEPCRRRVAKLRGVLATATEELLDMREGCPSPDELALLPPGAEHSDPHLRDCPLCREEVRLIFELESRRRLGDDRIAEEEASAEVAVVGHLPFYRPELLQRGGSAVVYQASGEPLEMELEDGAELDVPLGKAQVHLSCERGDLAVRVDGVLDDIRLVLVLSSATLEKRWPVNVQEARLKIGTWRRVRLEVEAVS